MRQLLDEGQHQQEVVDGALALQVSRPLSESLGELLGRGLEGQDPLVHAVDLVHHIDPQQVSVALDSGDDISVKPARLLIAVDKCKSF